MTNDTQENQNEIFKLKKIIIILLEFLEKTIENQNNIENKNILDLVLGKKDNIVSAICKLGNLMLKINLDESKNIDNDSNIDKIDIEFLEDYLKKK